MAIFDPQPNMFSRAKKLERNIALKNFAIFLTIEVESSSLGGLPKKIKVL